MAKITLILSIVFGLATAGIGFLNFQKLGDLKGRLGETETQLAQTKTSLEQASKSNVDFQKNVTDLNGKIATMTSDAEKLKSEIAVEKTKVSDLNEQLAAKEAEIASQKESADTQAKEIETLKETLAAKEAATVTPAEDTEKLNKLEEEKIKLLDQVSALQGKVNDLQQRVDEKAMKTSMKNLSGRILAVNQAWNFVVLDVGDKKGVLTNTELLVKRGGTAIGRVRITSVEPASSIADIIPASLAPGLTIQPGDQVIYPNEKL